MIKEWSYSGLAVCLALSGLLTLAGSATAQTENIRKYIEMMRSDLNTSKIATFNEVMNLDGEEAKTFWPIYREYEVELASLLDKRLELIERFVESNRTDTFKGEEAEQVAAEWFDLQERRLRLWKKYHKRFQNELSPMRAGQFVQIEHQVALFVDLTISSEMPVIGAGAVQ